MKILLIQPPSNIMYNRKESKPCLPPLGLAYIAGHLRSLGYEVKILDMQAEGYWQERQFQVLNNTYYKTDKDCLNSYIEYGLSEDGLFEVLNKFQPNYVGVSCIASQRHFQACNIIKNVKSYNGNIVTIMGGNHPTALPELVLKDCGNALDYLIKGEGELAFEHIIKKKPKEKIIDLEIHCNIDSLSLPAHDLLPLCAYESIWEKTNYHFYKPIRFAIMNTSRGCTHKCEHCPHEVVFGKGWRYRTLNKIEEEIDFLASLQVKEIQFHEYNGFINKQYMLEISKILKKYNMRWNVPIGVWVKPLTKDYLSELKNNGMNCIDLAIESPFQNILKTMPGKNVNIKQCLRVIKWCKEINLYSNGFFMIGFPNQTLEQMQNTITFAQDIGLDNITCFITQPLPGTKLWNRTKFIKNFHPFMIRYGKCNINSDLWTPTQVENIRHQVKGQ